MSSYSNAMDPEMYNGSLDGTPDTFTPPSVKDVGMSVPMGISAQNAAGIYSKIRMGAGSIEIGFPGKYSGNRQAMTPGMFGEDQRQAIKEISKLNEVNLTTHAAYNIMGLMGQDQRGNLSINNAMMDVEEIKAAIDFAADTAGGGSVVVHTGEWERPMTDMVIDDETGGDRTNLGWDIDGSGRNMFRQRPSEIADAQFTLIDDRDSRIYEQVQKDRKIHYPNWKTAETDNANGYDQDGNPTPIRAGDYVDYEGRKIKDENIYDPVDGRVPEFDISGQRFKTVERDFEYFKREASDKNEWLQRNWQKVAYEKGFTTREEFDKNWYYIKMYPEEAYLRATLESNEGYARGWALSFSERVESQVKQLDKLREARTYYEDLKSKVPADEQWKIMKQDTQLFNQTGGIVPPETKDPVQYVDDQIRSAEANLEYARLSAVSQEAQARDTAVTKEHLITPIKRFEKVTSQMYAMAAIHAMRKSSDPDNPVTLAIENIFPDRFGNHPQELKWLVGKVRERMVDMLTEDQILYGDQQGYPSEGAQDQYGANPYKIAGMTKAEATKRAEEHVKITFDTAHANLWRKYWQEDPSQSPEQNESGFKSWYLEQFEDLAKNKMIGNIHLVDNLGQWDDHLAPGQGNAPIKEVMHILEKHGYDKAITTEPGADASTDLSDFHGLMKTWRHLGSPIYGAGFGSGAAGGGGSGGSGGPGTWGSVQYSYFGQTEAPQYTFGAYAPSNDWTLWSQVPME